MIESSENWRGGREAEGAGLLNRYTDVYPYRGFESLPLRQFLCSSVRFSVCLCRFLRVLKVEFSYAALSIAKPLTAIFADTNRSPALII